MLEKVGKGGRCGWLWAPKSQSERVRQVWFYVLLRRCCSVFDTWYDTYFRTVYLFRSKDPQVYLFRKLLPLVCFAYILYFIFLYYEYYDSNMSRPKPVSVSGAWYVLTTAVAFSDLPDGEVS